MLQGLGCPLVPKGGHKVLNALFVHLSTQASLGRPRLPATDVCCVLPINLLLACPLGRFPLPPDRRSSLVCSLLQYSRAAVESRRDRIRPGENAATMSASICQLPYPERFSEASAFVAAREQPTGQLPFAPVLQRDRVLYAPPQRPAAVFKAGVCDQGGREAAMGPVPPAGAAAAAAAYHPPPTRQAGNVAALY